MLVNGDVKVALLPLTDVLENELLEHTNIE